MGLQEALELKLLSLFQVMPLMLLGIIVLFTVMVWVIPLQRQL